MMNSYPADVPVTIDVASTRFDADTDRGKEAAWELAALLRREFGTLPKTAADGDTKGDPITVGVILLALITSGAAGKAIDCVKTWLERAPLEREIRVKGSLGEKPIDLVVTAQNVGDQQVADILRSLSGKPLDR